MLREMLVLLLENERLKTTVDDFKLIARGLSDEVRDVSRRLTDANNLLVTRANAIVGLERRNRELVEENATLRLQRDNAVTDMRTAHISLSKLRGHYDSVRAEALHLRVRLNRYKTAALSTLYSGGDVLSLRETVRELRGKLDATLQAHSAQRETIEQLERKNKNLQAAYDRQSQAIREATSKLGGITIADLLSKPISVTVERDFANGTTRATSIGIVPVTGRFSTRHPNVYETKAPFGINSKE
jgi:chromosome segregation ATPase